MKFPRQRPPWISDECRITVATKNNSFSNLTGLPHYRQGLALQTRRSGIQRCFWLTLQSMMYEKKIGTCQILLFSFLKRAAYVLVVPESCARWLKITMAISFTLSFLSVRGLRPLGSKREKKNSFKILSISAIPALPFCVQRTKAAGAWGRQWKESLNCLPSTGMTAQKGNLLDLASGTCFTLQQRKFKSKLVVNYNFRIIHQLMCNTREISLPRLQFISTVSIYHSWHQEEFSFLVFGEPY